MGVTEPTQPTDFYVAGGTLRADAPSYIPRQADEDLYSALSRVHPCGTVRENRENRFRVRYGVDPPAMAEVVSCTEDGMCNSARPHGSVLFTSSTRGREAHVWDALTLDARSEPISLPLPTGTVWRDRLIAVTPDGSRLAVKTLSSIQQDGAESGGPVGEPIVRAASVPAIEYGPDGDLQAIADGSRVRLVRADGVEASSALDMGGQIADLTFDRGGAFLAVAVESEVRFVDYLTESVVLSWVTHPLPVAHIALDAHGVTLATVTNDSVTRVWNIATGRQIGEDILPSADIYDVAFQPLSRRLATADSDGRVTFWDIDAGRQYGAPMTVPGFVQEIVFTPDGKSLFTGERSGTAFRWRLPVPPASEEEMERRTEATTGIRWRADGQIERIPRSEWRALQASTAAP
jgi:WD40 repeat protein